MYPNTPTIFSELTGFMQQRRNNKIQDAELAYQQQVRDAVKQQTGFAPEAGSAIQGYKINDTNLRSADFNYGQQVKEQAGLEQFKNDVLQSDYPGLTPAILQMVASGAPSLMRQGASQLGQQDNAQFNSEIIPAAQTASQNWQTGERVAGQQYNSREAQLARAAQSQENRDQRQFAGEQGQLARQNNLDIAQLPNPLVQSQFMQQLLSFINPQMNEKGKVVGPPKMSADQAVGLGNEYNNPNLGALIMQQLLLNAQQQQAAGTQFANEFFKK
jgi:hypothetical protein